nr:cache domain-containing protein [Roseibium litorale]
MLITLLPLVTVSLLIGVASYYQAQQLIEAETASVEQRVLEAKKTEIRNYISLALTSIQEIYEKEPGGRGAAQAAVKRILNDMTFDEDGYFFVYELDGTNIVHPKLNYLVGNNWWDLQDPNGDYVIRNLILEAKKGGGFHRYVWHKPSTGKVEEKLAYAILLDKWGWMMGTGLYTDDIASEISSMNNDFEEAIRQTVIAIFAITLVAIMIAGTLIIGVRFSEQLFADVKLKELTKRIVDVQEQERKRVSTELHDSISQLLVSIRYGLEMIQAEAADHPVLKRQADKCLAILDGTLAEVRRISRDLRPSVLDDIGLAAALVSLGKEFEMQSGIKVTVSADRSHSRLSDGAKTALYRVVQEAMTNVARHSAADHVDIRLSVGPSLLTLTIEDNGRGLPMPLGTGTGLGIPNMRERMESHNGFLQLSNLAKGGTRIQVTMPLEKQYAPQSSQAA